MAVALSLRSDERGGAGDGAGAGGGAGGGGGGGTARSAQVKPGCPCQVPVKPFGM